MNKREGKGVAAGRDEDVIGGGCSGEMKPAIDSGKPFSGLCGLGEVAEETGYLIHTIQCPHVSNEGESLATCLVLPSATPILALITIEER